LAKPSFETSFKTKPAAPSPLGVGRREDMLKEKVQADIKEAMKSGDSFRLGVLRMLSSAFGNAEIAARGKADLQEADYQQVIKREVKKRTESI
jgi:uncharacterized protein YqeY